NSATASSSLVLALTSLVKAATSITHETTQAVIVVNAATTDKLVYLFLQRVADRFPHTHHHLSDPIPPLIILFCVAISLSE
ncbi:MAG: hypothetical protein ACLUGT_02850, partial [Lactobacillaceae bacterium]